MNILRVFFSSISYSHFDHPLLCWSNKEDFSLICFLESRLTAIWPSSMIHKKPMDSSKINSIDIQKSIRNYIWNTSGECEVGIRKIFPWYYLTDQLSGAKRWRLSEKYLLYTTPWYIMRAWVFSRILLLNNSRKGLFILAGYWL